MAPRRRHAVPWTACLTLALLLSACSTGGLFSAATPTPAAPSVSKVALWTNTFPPIPDNGAALRFQHYGLEQGLSQSSAQVIVQDPQGFLWVGTQDGLNRFDGYSFTVFRTNPDDPHALSSGQIMAMVADPRGGLWIGTDAGLNFYDPVTGQFSRWRHDPQDPDSLADDSVQALYQDPHGLLWVGTHGGLDTFNPQNQRFTHVHMLDKPAASGKTDSITALHEDRERVLWVGTSDGLIRLGLEEPIFRRYRNIRGEDSSLSYNDVCCISQDARGALWIGTRRGLNRLDPATGAVTQFLHSADDTGSLGDDYVETVIIDRAHQLWVGTRHGLDRFIPANGQFVHYQSDPTDGTSLSGSTVVSVFEDRGGMLWVGTFDGGLNLHDRSQDRFAYYHHVNGQESSLSSDLIFPILPAPNGRMWIGTYDAGLNLFDPITGQALHFRHNPMAPDSLLDDTVTALYQDTGHTLWIGTHQGMDRWVPGSTMFTHYVNHPDDPTTIPFGTVYRILQDRDDRYWVGTAHGLRSFDPVSGAFSTLQASGANAALLADNAVPAIFQDRTGKLWFGTGTHGLFRYDPATYRLEQYTNQPGKSDSLSIDSVLDVSQDSRGTIWVSTFGGGLNEYLPESNSFRRFRQAQGLPNDVVYGTLEDAGGKLWLSTNLGLSRFDPELGTFENFSVEDGLQSNEFDSYSFARDDEGRLYFGGVKGLTAFDPADIQQNSYVPPLAVTSLTQQDGKPVGAQRPEALDAVVLSYPENSFDVSFAALSYSHSDANQYKYMLQGFDREWHNVGVDHRGSYTNLPGGTYTLRMIGSNSDGVWNEAGATLKITVIPPFWETWLFRIPAGLVLVLAAFLAYRSRVRGIQAQKTELEHIVVDRTKALQKQNLDLEALYSADEKMLRVLSQDQVLQVLVDLAVDVLQADKSAVFTKTGESGEYVVRVSRGFRAGTAESSEFAQSQQALLSRTEAGEPVVVQDTLNDPGWTRRHAGIDRIAAAENIRSLMYIPMRVGDAALAVLNVCSSVPDAFDDDRQRLFSSLVQRAALSIENGRLFAQTRHMAILEERNRVAQELHDSAKQRAFAALAQLGAAKKLVDHQDRNAREHLVEAENIVSEVIHDLTFFIQESYSGGLKDKGLVHSLQEYAFSWQNRFNIPLSLSVSGERRLPLGVEQALYRVVQEALANIARHSQATRASVELIYQRNELRIRIGDNGRGFDAAKAADGLGLPLIQERLEGIGGRLKIESSEGGGTQLAVCVPLPEEVEEQHG